LSMSGDSNRPCSLPTIHIAGEYFIPIELPSQNKGQII